MHHCPECFKPLTTPQSRSRCLGEHVEWCKQYHTQLFKKGTSSQCEPCRRSDEEHQKRHREIAELLHELKFLKAENIPVSPLTPKALNTLQQQSSSLEDSPRTKKERKAAKKAKKVSEMPKVINSADIVFVAKVLHSHDSESDELEIERQLVDDPDIKLNRFFHKGTSNRRDIRNEFVKKEKRGNKLELHVHVEAEQLDQLLLSLSVSPTSASPSEKAIVAKLRDKIERDLIHVQKETEGMMMGKGGFWRWASKKAYNKLVQNGCIWGQKDSNGIPNKADGTTNSSSGSTVAGADTDSTETDTDITTPSEEDEIATSISGLTIDSPASSKTIVPSSPVDDGWTIIGNPSKVKKPVGNLTLVHNGGLAKLAQTPTPKRNRFVDFYREDDDFYCEDDDY